MRTPLAAACAAKCTCLVPHTRDECVSLPPSLPPSLPLALPLTHAQSCTHRNIEHIVPRAVILAAADSPGGPPPPANADACDDLYNMFLAVPNINRARRDYKFCAEPFGSDAKRRPTVIYGQLNSKKRKFSEKARDVWWSLGNGLFVNDRVARFVPREQDRGLIGRAVLHMADTWGCDADAVVEGGRSAAEQWHREYPADEAELAHIRHVAPLMSYPHSVFHEEKAGGLFSLRPAFTGDVVDK